MLDLRSISSVSLNTSSWRLTRELQKADRAMPLLHHFQVYWAITLSFRVRTQAHTLV